MNDNSGILRTVDLTVGFTGRQQVPVYSNIDIEAGKGEIIATLGQNGIGKSTLLRTIARLQKPVKGEIFLKGVDLNKYARLELAKIIGFVSTEIVQVHNMTIYDLVGLGRFPHTNWLGNITTNDKLLIQESIHLVGLDYLCHKNINEVSDGERQRAMIARTLAQDTEIIILDEPTAFLDLPNKYEIVHLLSELSRIKKKTVIFSTHDLTIAMQEADKIWLMSQDGIITGAPEDLVLNKSFSPIFENTKLQFDEQKGEIRIDRKTGRKIHLTGSGVTGLWTQRALERHGYELTSEDDCDTMVRIEIKDGIPIWIFEKKGEIIEFNSIYKLSLRLKQY